MPSSSAYLRSAVPQTFAVVTPVNGPSAENWSQGTLTSLKLDKFAKTILPSPVQVQLAQSFGKDSKAQSCFRHRLLPLFKSGFLPCRATKTLEKVCRRARQLQLQKRYLHINFLLVQAFRADWESSSTICNNWKSMTSACLLHFDGDFATMVRWIGGPHVVTARSPQCHHNPNDPPTDC